MPKIYTSKLPPGDATPNHSVSGGVQAEEFQNFSGDAEARPVSNPGGKSLIFLESLLYLSPSDKAKNICGSAPKLLNERESVFCGHRTSS